MSRSVYRDACTFALFRYGIHQIAIVIIDEFSYELQEIRGAIIVSTTYTTERAAVGAFKARVQAVLS